MRPFLLLLALLSACGRQRIQPIEAEYSTAERLLKQGEWQEALKLADSGFGRCGPSAEWCWKFRLLKAEALVAGRKNGEALALLDSAGTPPPLDLQARRLMNQGQARCNLSEYSQAEKLLDEALALARTSPSALLPAEVELRRGTLFMYTDRRNDAETTFRNVQEAAVRGGDPYLEAKAMGNLGVLFMDTPRLDEAISWLHRAADIFARLGASKLSARTVGNLGVCYYNLGDTEKGLAAFEQAASQLVNAGDPCSAQIWLGHSGNVFLDAENFPVATERYKKALGILEKCPDHISSAKWLINLALASIGSGQLDEAERYNNESLDLYNLHKDGRLKLYNDVNSARIAAGRGQLARAEELFRSVVNSRSEDPTPALEAQGGLAALYAQTGESPRADAQFRSAINVIESRQNGLTKDEDKLTYLSSLVRFYQSYVDFLVHRDAGDRALEVVESSRARILTGATTRVPGPHRLRTSDFQALARSSHRILLSYWLAPKQSYVWVITPANVKRLTLPPAKEIRSLVDAYRRAIEDGRDPIGSHLPAGEKLSAMLLDPLRQYVPRGSRVVIVPDGALHSLNFDTLPSPGDPSKYWIEDAVVSVAPSLGLMLQSRPSLRSSHLSLLAMGDPESPGKDYPRLPNARKEVETIAALFAASDRDVYEGKDLHPSTYQRAGPAHFSLIHFATHATANRASPLDSALILSPEGTGYALTARKIMQIPLDADLVTLSSCGSAGARTYSGEGLVGLTWAFLEAGAQRVIAGLWDVDDKATSDLMGKLYGALARGVSPEDALLEAKLSLLHASPYRKPYYWGPFQLYVGTERR